ncbi:Efflux pump roqT [Colletotrichum shisoi]|uniref:Efflux pump roqT n=1 Tax=Colletotrichum shisoi TaxID=2078593 RepID=A0A5Q4BUD4_9PEZI|nr:Efflux pump roqT [Colletotrichum shisoi]
MRQYIPIWFQAIKGVSAVESGLMNLALILATAVTSILAGVGITHIGYYNPFMIASTLLMAVGSGLLTTWNPDIPTRVWIGCQVLYGVGSGQSMQTPLVVVQTVLPMEEIPLGTALVMFLQTFGGAIFISVAQNIFTNELRAGLARDLPNINATVIVDGGATSIRQPGVLPPDALGPILQVYSQSLTNSWYVAVGLACASIAGSALVQWKTVKQAESPAVTVENGSKDERDATEDGMEMEFHRDLSTNGSKRTDIFSRRSDAI